MKSWVLSLAAVVALGAIVAIAGAATGFHRSDCLGQVVCPLTGDEVCRDRCPLADTARNDCPGKIECPIDGQLVCRDQCPQTQGSGLDNKLLMSEDPCFKPSRRQQRSPGSRGAPRRTRRAQRSPWPQPNKKSLQRRGGTEVQVLLLRDLCASVSLCLCERFLFRSVNGYADSRRPANWPFAR